MRILLTGATSFTGAWFAEKLLEKGHDVLCAVRGAHANYDGLRAQRLARLEGRCRFVWEAPFGSQTFLDAVKAGGVDLLCHHAAEVRDYKSPDFDALAATAANTHNLPAVLAALRNNGCGRILLTGSVFEADEGAGTMPLRAFSPYGLSKTLTAQIFRFRAEQQGFALGKFVITNPFGPQEDPRFTEYLMRCWKDGKPASVNTPAYVRDNVPVTLMAEAYAAFAEALPASGFHKLTPSFYAEEQSAFARRFAAEMGARLALDCALNLAEQTAFPEPTARIGTDRLDPQSLDWSEDDFWDETARYYAAAMNIQAAQRPGRRKA